MRCRAQVGSERVRIAWARQGVYILGSIKYSVIFTRAEQLRSVPLINFFHVEI